MGEKSYKCSQCSRTGIGRLGLGLGLGLDWLGLGLGLGGGGMGWVGGRP